MDAIVAPPPRSSPKSFGVAGAGSGRVIDTVATRATGKGTTCALLSSDFGEGGARATGVSVVAVVEFSFGGFEDADAVVAGALAAGGVALAASAAAVAAACFLIAPVMSSILLSSNAMRPANRS